MTPSTYRPKVSIVMSFCNEPLQWIRFAVESVLEQTFRDYELIIVCDNPANTEGISYIEDLDDKRIILIVNKENIGPTRSFNSAIASSKGEYIARMDADDICLSERLARQVEYLDCHPEVSVCATDTHSIDRSGKIIRRNRYRKKHDHRLLAISNCIAHPSVMFRRSLLEIRNPLYNEDYIYSQDYELWQFLLLKGIRFHTLDQALLLYRRSDEQISSAKRRKQAELFKKAHKKFITEWLIANGITSSEDTDLKVMLKKASRAYSEACKEDRKQLKYIIHVLYFSLGTIDKKYRLLYFFDRNLIAFRIRFIYTYRLLFSTRTRRDRTGLV